MANTGVKNVLTLRKYVNGVATNEFKANVVGDPDYIATYEDLTSCPLSGTTPVPEPPPVYAAGFRTDTGSPISSSACGTSDQVLYASTSTFGNISIGTKIYSGTSGILFAGGNLWFGIASSSGDATKTILIDNSGIVTNDADCALPEPPATTWYRFEECVSGNFVWQTLGSEPTNNSRWTDGFDFYIYNSGPSSSTTIEPSPLTTSLTNIGLTGCPGPPPPPPPPPQEARAEVRACSGGPSLYYTFSNYPSLPSITPNAAVEIAGVCYEILDANYTGILDDGTVTGGQIYASGCSDSACTSPEPNTFNVTNNSSGNYVINGQSNPTLTITEGETYTFNINATGHPFWIKTNTSTGTANQYNDGVTNNGTDNGVITFVVPFTAPSTLYYNCQFHSSMAGVINVIDVPNY